MIDDLLPGPENLDDFVPLVRWAVSTAAATKTIAEVKHCGCWMLHFAATEVVALCETHNERVLREIEK